MRKILKEEKLSDQELAKRVKIITEFHLNPEDGFNEIKPFLSKSFDSFLYANGRSFSSNYLYSTASVLSDFLKKADVIDEKKFKILITWMAEKQNYYSLYGMMNDDPFSKALGTFIAKEQNLRKLSTVYEAFKDIIPEKSYVFLWWSILKTKQHLNYEEQQNFKSFIKEKYEIFFGNMNKTNHEVSYIYEKNVMQSSQSFYEPVLFAHFLDEKTKIEMYDFLMDKDQKINHLNLNEMQKNPALYRPLFNYYKEKIGTLPHDPSVLCLYLMFDYQNLKEMTRKGDQKFINMMNKISTNIDKKTSSKVAEMSFNQKFSFMINSNQELKQKMEALKENTSIVEVVNSSQNAVFKKAYKKYREECENGCIPQELSSFKKFVQKQLEAKRRKSATKVL